MDPLTLFALANGAVSAVKAGCKLYKDIKGAAGDVKDVLKDLDNQFHKAFPPGKTPTVEQRNQYVKEKNRVIELNKREGETVGIYSEIGRHLGTYYDNYFKCLAIFEEEEKRSKTELYTGDASIGHRALDRVLMRKQLEQMGKELAELMIYQSPTELGSLYSEVEDMMKVIGKQQKALLVAQIQKEQLAERRRQRRMAKLKQEAIWGVVILIIILTFGAMMMYVAYDRQQKYPQYGKEIIPKNEKRRAEESESKVYVGR